MMDLQQQGTTPMPPESEGNGVDTFLLAGEGRELQSTVVIKWEEHYQQCTTDSCAPHDPLKSGETSQRTCALIQSSLPHTPKPPPTSTHTHTHTFLPTPSPDPGDFHLHSLLAQLMACIDSRPAERVPASYGECCTVPAVLSTMFRVLV